MNRERQLSNIKILVIIGFTLIAFSLTLGVVTYVIAQWVVYTGWSNVTTDWNNYSRTKGIFQECVDINTNLSIVIIKKPYVLKDNCIDIDIGQFIQVKEDQNHTMIIRMRQSQIGTHGASLILLLIILIMGIGVFLKWCCSFIDTSFYIKWRITLGSLSIIAFLCLAASSSLGTALIIIETDAIYNTSLLPYSPFNPQNPKFPCGYMFYLSWTATLLSLLAAILFLVSSCLGKTLELEKYKPHVVTIDNPGFMGDESKVPEPKFLQPTGSFYGFTSNPATVKENSSSGLLPRYDISTFR